MDACGGVKPEQAQRFLVPVPMRLGCPPTTLQKGQVRGLELEAVPSADLSCDAEHLTAPLSATTSVWATW